MEFKEIIDFVEENKKEYLENELNSRDFTKEEDEKRLFTITFEDEVHKRWSGEFIFHEFEDAKEYLINQGFTEINRLFERKNYNWSYYVKAYISPRKVYSRGLCRL